NTSTGISTLTGPSRHRQGGTARANSAEPRSARDVWWRPGGIASIKAGGVARLWCSWRNGQDHGAAGTGSRRRRAVELVCRQDLLHVGDCLLARERPVNDRPDEAVRTNEELRRQGVDLVGPEHVARQVRRDVEREPVAGCVRGDVGRIRLLDADADDLEALRLVRGVDVP